MIAPEVIATLEEILARERSSFVRYVIEASQPPVFDEADGRSLAFCQDFYRETQRSIDSLTGLLAEEGVIVSEAPRWHLRFTNFNYLRPRYLLRVLLTETEDRLDALESQAQSLQSLCPRAQDVVSELLRCEREQLARLRDLVDEMPEPPAEPPQLKGTSASRW